MNTDNHKNIQEDLVNRYLNADTTIEEEHLLANFLSKNRESLSPEEEDVYLLLQASARDTDHFELSLEENNMTQKQLANEVGVSPSRISDYVSGRAEPTLKIARLLCRVLNITPSAMLGF